MQCCWCNTNYTGYNKKGTVFSLPQNEELRKKWLTFLNRKDSKTLKQIFIYEHHLDYSYLKKNETRTRLNMAMNSVPTRLVRSQKNVPTLLFSAVEKIRKPPMK